MSDVLGNLSRWKLDRLEKQLLADFDEARTLPSCPALVEVMERLVEAARIVSDEQVRRGWR